jgi:hypothetical protein
VLACRTLNERVIIIAARGQVCSLALPHAEPPGDHHHIIIAVRHCHRQSVAMGQVCSLALPHAEPMAVN